MTDKQLFNRADYYNRKAAEYNKLVNEWFRRDCPIEVISEPTGGLRIQPKITLPKHPAPGSNIVIETLDAIYVNK